MKTASVAFSVVFWLLFPLAVLANAWTPFVENIKVGGIATHDVQVVPAGFDNEWEYFVLVVHSDTFDTYGLRARAKPGVMKTTGGLPFVSRWKVTAKLLKLEFHQKKRLVNAELQIITARPLE